MEAKPKAITVAILAMGGEGGGVLADWIVDMAERGGYFAQTTSVPGVAQRTGSTIYYVELFPESSKQPVLALMPVPGEVDLVIASELMEAARAVQRGLVTPDRTTLIASTHRVYSMTERTAMADGRVDSEQFVDACSRAAKNFVRADFGRIAEDAGSVISASVFGAVAATSTLPFERAQFEDAIRRSGVGVESSLAAFGEGFKDVAHASACRVATLGDTFSTKSVHTSVNAARTSACATLVAKFPERAQEVLSAGVQRLVDYQDERYAAKYLDCLDPLRDTEDVLVETARYLALWMSYEDAIRVADLKIRRSRFERVRTEARVGTDQLLQINEFLHPRVQEIADILPAPLGRWLLKTGWARGIVEKFTKDGRVLQTTSIVGFLQLYVLASLRRWRPKSLRFQLEQEKIAAWLARVTSLAKEDPALALEVAECASLIKGYGDTHALGTRNFDVIMSALPLTAHEVRRLREAALADDTGRKLTEVLREVNA